MADALKRYAGPIAAAVILLLVGAAMLIGWPPQRQNPFQAQPAQQPQSVASPSQKSQKRQDALAW